MAQALMDITNVMDSDESSETSTTEEVDSIESIIKDTTASWLAIHGAKLFGLETSKFLAQEARRKDVKSKR